MAQTDSVFETESVSKTAAEETPRVLDVIGLGAMNMDLVYTVERVVLDGETIVNEFGSYPGGSAANTIYGLARLGLKTGFVGAVGNDSYGHRLEKDFRSVGVDTLKLMFKPGADTGQALCITDRCVRSLYILPGANSLLGWDNIDNEYLSSARLLHLSSFLNDAQLDLQRKLVGEAPDTVKVSFSPGSLYVSRGIESLRPIIERASVLFLNEGELRELTGMGLRQGAEKLLSLGCAAVVATSGEGLAPDEIGALLQEPLAEDTRLAAYVADGREETIVRAKTISEWNVRDTTGAGDAFAAGFLFGWLHGKGRSECGILGDTMAQFCIRKAGARAGLPTLSELFQKYDEWYAKTI